ncbi:MAG: FecR family protein [Lutibacter sp.]
MSTRKIKELDHKNKALYSYLKELPEDINIDIEKEKRAFFERIEKRKIKLKYYSILKYAAVIALMVTAGYYYTKDKVSSNHQIVIDNNIEIGKNKAVLTLEDGNKVTLEKGKSYAGSHVNSDGEKLIYEKNKEETKNSITEIIYNYLTVPRGGEFFIELADNTKVWLNSESKIKFPVEFLKGASRKVELVYGEAYFEVSPSSEHHGNRFVVLSQGQEIEVVGTEFNVKAYQDESIIKTTLVKGKVTLKIDNKIENLNPSQQSIYNKKTGDIELKEVNTYHEISWVHGEFSFNNKSLEEIMIVLSRWYNIDIEIKSKYNGDFKYNGTLGKAQNIEIILLSLKNTNNLEYVISDGKVIIN